MREIPRFTGVGITVCLLASAFALAVAPLFMPDGYSWVTHTTSESAAQGVEAAWVARLGFLLFGLAVIWLVAERRPVWGRLAAAFHAGFGVLLVSTAVFSTKSWDVAVPYNPIEDMFHSATATLMGFSFVFGVLVLVLRRRRTTPGVRWLDLVALSATVVFPVLMLVLNEFGGLLQRLMFLVAYAWFLREASLLSVAGNIPPDKRQ